MKALFKASQPGGKPGGFLTKTGFPASTTPAAARGRSTPRAPSFPIAQFVPTTGAQALPGGSVQTWPGSARSRRSTDPNTERVAYFDAAASPTTRSSPAPTTTPPAPGRSRTSAATRSRRPCRTRPTSKVRTCGPSSTRSSSTATPSRRWTCRSPGTYPQNGSGPDDRQPRQLRRHDAKNVTSVSVTLAARLHLPRHDLGPGAGRDRPDADLDRRPRRRPRRLHRGPFTVAVDPSVSSTLGSKNFGQFTALYGDDYGEGFKVNVCRDITIEPVPAPSLTKTRPPGARLDRLECDLDAELRQSRRHATPEQRPPGHAAARLHVRLELLVAVARRSDRDPGQPDPAPLERRQRQRQHAERGHRHDHRAGRAITSGTGTPPQQTFTNNATLLRKDASGNDYSVNASADVIVQALDSRSASRSTTPSSPSLPAASPTR